MIPGKAIPVDWTNGTGTLTAGTTNIPAEEYRNGWRIQNLDTTALSVVFACTKGSDGTSCNGTIVLAPAASAGAAGGLLDSGQTAAFVTNGAFSVVGTSGKQASIITY